MVELFIFRHGETDWNAQRRWQGHIDVPLNDQGRSQALKLFDELVPSDIQVILSSDLKRAVETAKIVADLMNVYIYQDAGLRECHLGAAQGLVFQEVLDKFGLDALEKWNSLEPDDLDWGFPEGETKRQQLHRALSAIARFVKDHPQFERIGVSTHGGVIRSILAHIGGVSAVPIPIPNCAVYRIRFESEGEYGRLWLC